MCGIAGVVDLSGRGRTVPQDVLNQMGDAIRHRGPDEDGIFISPGVGLVSRRLSILGIADGQQPLSNEDGSVVATFNGEFFDYPEKRQLLESQGHSFRTHTDTELIPHLWEDYGQNLFTQLRGQFAVACVDLNRRQLILGRDRFGICPLFWTRQTIDGSEWLLFASEIKALLGSGWVTARPDRRGIDQVFNFLSLPGPPTCFEGITLLQPGHSLTIDFPSDRSAVLTERIFWEIDFPVLGNEHDGDDQSIVDGLEEVLSESVERRLRADVPVVSYLSGGIDSSIVVALACKIRGQTIPTFTIQVLDPKLDETSDAAVMARHIGSQSVVVPIGDNEIVDHYPELIRAAEAPVMDTSCVGLLLLAQAVHRTGNKVALTGEGSDEWLGGYSWFKIHKMLDALNGGGVLRRGVRRLAGFSGPTEAYFQKVSDVLGHHSAFQDFYAMISLSRERFYSAEMKAALEDHMPYELFNAPFEKIRKWHPINQGVYWASRVHLPGHLLSSKGDRVAMNSSVETRYPFLDEKVCDYLSALHPRWKLRFLREKYVLRKMGERHLPYEVAWRKKGMFRAPLDSFFSTEMPNFVNQLLSPESLRKTGYFDVAAVTLWGDRIRQKKIPFYRRTFIEIGMVGVLATQLWHHIYIDGSLCELPSGWQRPGTSPFHSVGKSASASDIKPQ